MFTLLIKISLSRKVGSKSLCCVPLSKNFSPLTLSLNQNGWISFFSEPLLKKTLFLFNSIFILGTENYLKFNFNQHK